MKKKIRYKLLIPVIIIIAIAALLLLIDFGMGVFRFMFQNDVNEVAELIEKHYIMDGSIRKKELLKISKNPYDVVASLNDPYSEFLNAEELNTKVDKLNENYVGLGFEANKKVGEYIEILNISGNSPAMKSGLQIGDRIISIDGKNTKNMDRTEALSLIRGEENSTVDLEIERNEDIHTISITRRKIASNVASSTVFNEKVGYIYLSGFPLDAHKAFENEIYSLINKNISSLIIDLRGNTGGEIEEIEPIASLLVPDQYEHLFTIKHKTMEDEKYYRSNNSIYSGNIYVLVNSYTASAAEMLTAILKEFSSAIVIGEKTFGKGITQSFFYLRSENILKLTAGIFELPNGDTYNGIGIVPDIVVPMPSENIEQSVDDTQLIKAIELALKSV